MKKFILGALAAITVICVLVSIAGYVGYEQLIKPNSDWEQTVTINGETVTQVNYSKSTMNNILVGSTNESVDIVNKLNRLDSDNSKEEFTQKLTELEELTNKYVAQLEKYEATLVNYDEYKEFILATITYHQDSYQAVKEFFSAETINIISSDEPISQEQYDKYSAAVDKYNEVSEKIELDYNEASAEFKAESES